VRLWCGFKTISSLTLYHHLCWVKPSNLLCRGLSNHVALKNEAQISSSKKEEKKNGEAGSDQHETQANILDKRANTCGYISDCYRLLTCSSSHVKMRKLRICFLEHLYDKTINGLQQIY